MGEGIFFVEDQKVLSYKVADINPYAENINPL